MEIKINKEIRDYKENIFFGLSTRQFIFSLIACIVAVLIYFLCRNKLGLEITSWLCILGAIPFGALGFVKYNGMNAEELLVAFIKSEILMPKVLHFKPTNIYEEMIKEDMKNIEREEYNFDRNRKKKEKENKRQGRHTKNCTTINTNKENI